MGRFDEFGESSMIKIITFCMVESITFPYQTPIVSKFPKLSHYDVIAPTKISTDVLPMHTLSTYSSSTVSKLETSGI